MHPLIVCKYLKSINNKEQLVHTMCEGESRCGTAPEAWVNTRKGHDSLSLTFLLFLFFSGFIFHPMQLKILYKFLRVLEALFLSHLVTCYSEFIGFFLNCVVQNFYFLSDDGFFFPLHFPLVLYEGVNRNIQFTCMTSLI